jgi:hypothetical protein
LLNMSDSMGNIYGNNAEYKHVDENVDFLTSGFSWWRNIFAKNPDHNILHYKCARLNKKSKLPKENRQNEH